MIGPALCFGLGACGRAPAVDRLVGEVHLHQYTSGAHVTVLFVEPPTPVGKSEYDSVLPSVVAPSYEEGGCKVFPTSGCVGACAQPTPVDGGRVQVTGLPRAVDLGWDASIEGYDELIVDGSFLAGGAIATVRGLGNDTMPAFRSTVTLPAPIAPASTLDSGLAAGFQVSWTPTGDRASVKVLLNVVPKSGPGAAVSCFLDDAEGRLVLSDAILARLPPPPRQVQLEVSRDRLVQASLGDGRGVILHGGFAVLSARSED